MFQKLDDIERKYEEIAEKMSGPDVLANPQKIAEYNKNYLQLQDIVEKYREYKKLKEEQVSLREDIKEEKDEEMKEMMNTEIYEINDRLEEKEKEMKLMLLPKDPNDGKNIFLEIRAGAGGDEASIFAADVFRMYSRYAEKNKWKVEIIDTNDTGGIGGYKEVICMIKGKEVYGKLKYESGVHRVQRVPATEASGRIHTSTITVAIMPEVEEVEVNIDPKDLRIDTYRSGGAGGQHVNMTDSAVRITHLPSGIVTSCQDERSQLKNKDKAMKVLVAKIYEMEQEKRRSQIDSDRKLQVGTGERSEKIRTYNYPQGRVTDHRINLTLYKLDQIMDGEIEEIIEALRNFDQADQLQRLGENE